MVAATAPVVVAVVVLVPADRHVDRAAAASLLSRFPLEVRLVDPAVVRPVRLVAAAARLAVLLLAVVTLVVAGLPVLPVLLAALVVLAAAVALVARVAPVAVAAAARPVVVAEALAAPDLNLQEGEYEWLDT